MNRIIAAAAAGAVLAIALTACSSGVHSGPVSPTPSAKQRIYAGENAATIAKLIDGCEDVSTAKTSGELTYATCNLDGRMLVVNSWPSTTDITSVHNVVEANGIEMYYAAGKTWTVTPGDDPTLQMQLTNDAGGLTSEALSGDSSEQGDVPGQRASALAVVKALGGTVVHVAAS